MDKKPSKKLKKINVMYYISMHYNTYINKLYITV